MLTTTGALPRLGFTILYSMSIWNIWLYPEEATPFPNHRMKGMNANRTPRRSHIVP
jgi:hypothetical protein